VKILKISDVYFPRVNGVSTSIATFMRDLISLGHEPTLVAPKYGDAPDPRNIRRVAARRVPRDPEDRIMSWRELRGAVSELCRQERFDVMHIHTPFLAQYAGVRAAREFGLPVIATYHTLFEEYLHHYVPLLPRRAGRSLARAISRSQCNQLDAVISPSIAMRDALRAYGVEKRIEVLPTGLDSTCLTLGDGAAFRKKHGIALDRPVLLFVGRVAYEKNLGFLLKMFSAVARARPDALLLIAGEGPALTSIKSDARAMGLEDSVRFVGYLGRDGELQDCYRSADLFVFASLTETQGLVLLEAMAQAVPVVAIARMGTIDILASQTGCRVAPPEAQGFADIVVDLLADSALRGKLGEAAREYARSWSSLRQAERLALVYESLRRPAIAHTSHKSVNVV
jgi:glycosyltransferase involved in cell wall biosynthesis